MNNSMGCNGSNRARLWGALLLPCLVATAACAATPADDADVTATVGALGQNDITWAACPEDFETECAWVPLPVDHAVPDGPALPIFVSRYLAKNGPARAQLWLLHGGPGASGSIFKGAIDRLLAPLMPDVDFYILEHRGVGESARLGCPAYEADSSQGGSEITRDELPACVADLQAHWGDRLQHFTTTADAHDLASLIERTREPDKKVFVYGVSYGTTRAMRLLQAHPNVVDGVILDSVVSPGVQFASRGDTYMDPVAQELAKLCAADATCGGKLGNDPWLKLQAVLDKLDHGHCPKFLQRSTLRQRVAQLIAHPELRRHVFPLFYRLDRCDPPDVAVVENYMATLDQMFSPPPGPLRQSNLLGALVSTSELWEEPAPSQDELAQRCASQTFCPDSVHGWVYDLMPRYPRDQYSDGWPSAEAPILAMNGTLDPNTPLTTASVAAMHFTGPHQSFVTVPRSAHSVLTSSYVKTPNAPTCGAQLVASFVQDPTRDPDTSCLGELEPLSFTASSGLDMRLFGTMDFWENAGPHPMAAAPPARSRPDAALPAMDDQH